MLLVKETGVVTIRVYTLIFFVDGLPIGRQVDGWNGARRTSDRKLPRGRSLGTHFVVRPAATFEHPQVAPHPQGAEEFSVPVLSERESA